MQYRATALTPLTRLASALLLVVSRGSLLVMLALLLFFDTNLDNQLRLMKLFALFCLVPGVVAWLLGRGRTVTLRLEGDSLVWEDRRRHVEIPLSAIDGIVPWRVPLPSGGLWLRMRSGKRFSQGFRLEDPTAFVDALVKAGAPPRLRATPEEPSFLYTRLESAAQRRWYGPILKYLVFALVPTLPLFRLHQWIAYGGTFGEYYTYGLEAYLVAFGIYWSTLIIYLAMYGALLRGLAEAAALVVAHVVPSQAARTRRVVELVQRIAYFGGVLLLLVIRFVVDR